MVLNERRLKHRGDWDFRWLNGSQGQGLTEYIVIAVLIAVVVIVAVRKYGSGLRNSVSSATDAVSSAGAGDTPDRGIEATEDYASRSAPTETGGDEDADRGVRERRERGSEHLRTQRFDEDSLRAQGVGAQRYEPVEKITIGWWMIGLVAGIVIALGVAVVLYNKNKRSGKKKKKGRFSRDPSGSSGSAPPNAGGNEGGQILVIGLIMSIALVMVSLSVANIGIMVAEKIRVQDTVDAAAYSAATAEARYMNLTAYVNRAILANYDAMAFNMSLWASVDAYDHGIASIVSGLYLIAGIIQIFPPLIPVAEALDMAAYGVDRSVHNFFHQTNQKLNEWFDQSEDYDFNQYIEIYNTDILSTLQGVLYATLQSSRYGVAEEVANQMDSDVLTTSVLGLAAETVSADDLREAVDWVITDPDDRTHNTFLNPFNEAFDRAFGTDDDEDSDSPTDEVGGPTDDHVVLLGALAEASLDKFSAGWRRDGTANLVRQPNLGNILPDWMEDGIEAFLWAECVAECGLTLGLSCDCDNDVSIRVGGFVREGEEDHFGQDRVPVIARRRLREVNAFGMQLDMSWLLNNNPLFSFPSNLGHTSGEVNADIANMANKDPTADVSWGRVIECTLNPGKCTYNEYNALLSKITIGGFAGSVCNVFSGGGWYDDHWDGSFDPQPTCGTRYVNFNICVGDVVEYAGEVCGGGFEEGVPRYDYWTDLPQVGFPNYHYDEHGATGRPAGSSGGGSHNLLTGPSLAVVGVKPADRIPGLQGLGIGNEYPITAIARAQVYYLHNPNRPDEKPSLFNPHWVPRLAPIDSDDTPDLLRRGLPYVMGFGAPIKPTH